MPNFFFPFSDKSAPFFQFFFGPAGALLKFFFWGGGFGFGLKISKCPESNAYRGPPLAGGYGPALRAGPIKRGGGGDPCRRWIRDTCKFSNKIQKP